jgi:hypothetical protein
MHTNNLNALRMLSSTDLAGDLGSTATSGGLGRIFCFVFFMSPCNEILQLGMLHIGGHIKKTRSTVCHNSTKT